MPSADETMAEILEWLNESDYRDAGILGSFVAIAVANDDQCIVTPKLVTVGTGEAIEHWRRAKEWLLKEDSVSVSMTVAICEVGGPLVF